MFCNAVRGADRSSCSSVGPRSCYCPSQLSILGAILKLLLLNCIVRKNGSSNNRMLASPDGSGFSCCLWPYGIMSCLAQLTSISNKTLRTLVISVSILGHYRLLCLQWWQIQLHVQVYRFEYCNFH